MSSRFIHVVANGSISFFFFLVLGLELRDYTLSHLGWL
jgi:hypothetical protein